MYIKDFRKINNYLWEIPQSFRSDMRVPARIYASEKMLQDILKDRSVEQLINGTTLPGIVKYGIAMPDCHEGYSVPIGFVGAIRTSDGVISPGACGFDINCISGDTRVLSEYGAYFSIEQLEKLWQNKKVGFVDFSNKELNEARIVYFLKKYNNPTIYQIVTENGEKIKVTSDHPIQTKNGMKAVRLLKEKDEVLIYPFKGVKYKKPSKKILLGEEEFKKVLIKLGKNNKQGHAVSQIFNQLKSRNLLPLRYDSPYLASILKLMGFIFGDGVISFGKNIQINFYGKPEDLKEIQKDISNLRFTSSRVYSRKRNHSITTFYGTCKFSSIEYSIRNSSSALASLLIALNTPYGIKSHKSYRVPKWIFNCPLWQQRLFIGALFGAELSTPSTINKYNFYSPQLNMQKIESLKKEGKLFLKDIAKLLKNFKVKTCSIKDVPGYKYKGKQGETSGLRLQISENSKNLIRFFETISFIYNFDKQKEACLAVSYLKKKLRIVELRNKIRKRIRVLYKKRGDFKKLAKKYSSDYISTQFLYHSIFEEDSWGVRKKRGDPGIAFNFPSFKGYKKRYSYGNKGLVWERIKKIKIIPYQDFVYDFTLGHPDHNFIANNFVVSNCGMRLLKSERQAEEIRPFLERLASEIQKQVPSGLGVGRKIKLSIKEIDKILNQGTHVLLEQGYGEKEDIDNCEATGKLEWADASVISDHAKNRGRDQIGTLGSGNHFSEVQKVAEIFDQETAEKFGLYKDQVVIMIHTGSRGLGHQVCSDYLKTMIPAMEKYDIKVPDKEFACVPFSSKEGRKYFSAMAGAANYAWANRHMIAYYIRKAWKETISKEEKLELLYDVAHNIIKKESYNINGEETEVIVHRKGATRAFPNQPVLIPGSMGTASYILVGTEKGEEAFFSTSHGAGRAMSRTKARKLVSGENVISQLNKKGIIVKCWSKKGIAEEAPQAYKDIDSVVAIVDQAGLSKKVAKLTPLAVIKGE